MRLLDLTLPSPADNLALDEALLLAAEEHDGGEVLRVWELPTPAVVVGAGGSVALDVNVASCAAEGIPILRRASGGGTVLLGPGCLCYSLVLAYDRAPGLDQIPLSNRYVLGRIARALHTAAPTAALAGTSDLAVSGESLRKFSGNAQQRKRRYFLHHGTLLYGFDLESIPRYLNPPERQPDYRLNRPHRDFVTNLHLSAGALRSALVQEWEITGDYAPLPWDLVNQLVGGKYGTDEWNRRR